MDKSPLRTERWSAPQGASQAEPFYNSQWMGPVLCIVTTIVWLSSFAFGFETAVGILTLIGLGGAVIGLFIPTLGLLSISMLCTLDPITRVYVMTGGIFRWNTVNYLLILTMILCLPVVGRLRDVHTRILEAFLLLLLLGLTYSSDFENGIVSFLNISSILGLMVYFCRALGDGKVLLWVGIVNGTVAAVGATVYFISMNSIAYINPNAWALYPLTGLFCVCLAVASVKPGSTMHYVLSFLGMVNVVLAFLSGSRGAMLMALACLFYLLFTMGDAVARGTICVTGILMAGMLLMTFNEQGQVALHRVEKLLNDDLSADERTSGRAGIYEIGWDMFLENPFGVGTGGFKEEFAGQSGTHANRGLQRNAHSAWMMTLVENGFLGWFVFSLYVGSFALMSWIRRREGVLGLGLLVTCVLATSFIAREFQGKGPFLLAAGAVVFFNSRDRFKRDRPLGHWQTGVSFVRASMRG